MKKRNPNKMNASLHRWRTMLLCLPAALVMCGIGWVCVNVIHGLVHGLGVVMSDGTKFEYDHNLPRAYVYHMTRNLITLQEATVEYAQHHKGFLPPMQSSTAVNALRPYLQHKIPWRTYNPATQIPFTPHKSRSRQTRLFQVKKIGALGKDALLFYDANPPAGYRESYYVTVIGKVGHVPVAALPKLLQKPTEQ